MRAENTREAVPVGFDDTDAYIDGAARVRERAQERMGVWLDNVGQAHAEARFHREGLDR